MEKLSLPSVLAIFHVVSRKENGFSENQNSELDHGFFFFLAAIVSFSILFLTEGILR
jgi:hypothetical protein